MSDKNDTKPSRAIPPEAHWKARLLAAESAMEAFLDTMGQETRCVVCGQEAWWVILCLPESETIIANPLLFNGDLTRHIHPKREIARALSRYKPRHTHGVHAETGPSNSPSARRMRGLMARERHGFPRSVHPRNNFYEGPK